MPGRAPQGPACRGVELVVNRIVVCVSAVHNLVILIAGQFFGNLVPGAANNFTIAQAFPCCVNSALQGFRRRAFFYFFVVSEMEFLLKVGAESQSFETNLRSSWNAF